MKTSAKHGTDETRYGLTWPQRAFPLIAGGLAAFAVMGVAALAGSQLPTARDTGFLCLGWLLGIVVALLSWPRDGVTLTSREIAIHSPRARTVKWSKITDIMVEKNFGSAVVILLDDSGKRIKLGAPRAFLDGKFEEKVRVIRNYWLGQFTDKERT